MSYNLDQHPGKTGSIWILLAAALAFLAWAFGAVTWASAQKLTPPTPPALIAPPAGNFAFLGKQALVPYSQMHKAFKTRRKFDFFLAP